MALTPEDVVNKRFQPTKFREGYDQDEVDDFLDEVVVELRRLNSENEELRQRLVAGDARISELQRTASQAASAPSYVNAPPPVVAPEPVAAPAPAAPVYAAPPVDANPLDPNNTNNLLQLARRLHEEHVREGVEKRDALIAEGQAQATQITQDAEQNAQTRLQEADQAAQARLAEVDQAAQARLQDAEQAAQARLAEIEQQVQARQAELDRAVQARQQELEQQARAQIATLDQERVQLEGKIADLQTFEREYRAKLKSYIEGQLNELDDTASASQQAPVGAQGYSAPPASYPGFAQN